MAEVTRHNPGSFSWAELATTDPIAAKRFYTSLFGWSIEDNPFGPGPEDIYTRLQQTKKDVGALYPMRPEQRQQGVPPNWLPYVAVTSADEAAKKVKQLGGKILMEPLDVMTFGRMAVLEDPAGATLALWEAREHIGAQRVNEPGAFCWMELLTSDAKATARFYSDLFGWTAKESTVDNSYTEFWQGESPVGGQMPIKPEWGRVPPHWTVYWQVEDVDATTKKATSLGARVLSGPQDIPTVGRFSSLQDPQGASFSIFKPAPRA
jgi:uncharacterized protein